MVSSLKCWVAATLFSIEYKYFHIVFKLVQLLNLLKRDYLFPPTADIFVCDFGNFL